MRCQFDWQDLMQMNFLITMFGADEDDNNDDEDWLGWLRWAGELSNRVVSPPDYSTDLPVGR